MLTKRWNLVKGFFSKRFSIDKRGPAGEVHDYRPLKRRESEIGLLVFLSEGMTGKALEQSASGASAWHHLAQVGALGIAPR